MKLLVTATMSLASLGLSAIANASQVGISGTAYSSDNCAYYSTSLADLKVSFVDEAITYGSRVILRYGFHDTFYNSDWAAPSQIEMNASAPYTWNASLNGVQVDARGDSFYASIQFDFQVISADGAVTYDNGGSSFGYYQATLPARNCARGTLQPLPQTVINK